MAFPLSSGSASEQSDIPRARSFSSPPQWSTTVILFCVRVPVLSEQIIWVHPRVSTAVRRRIIAFCFDIFVTPIERTIVTTATSPSGIAATARLTASMKVLSTLSVSNLPFLIRLNTNMNTQIPSTSFVSIPLSWDSFFWSGVCPSSASVMAVAILPISVFIPVPVTTILPRP